MHKNSIRYRPWWFYPLWVMVTAFLCIVVAEVPVRILWSPRHPRDAKHYKFDADVGTVNIPGTYRKNFVRCLWGEKTCENIQVPFTINSEGFRSEEFRHPPGEPLVVVLGDSMIEAQQVEDDKTACSILKKLLQIEFPNVEVRNIGMSSTGFVHYYARWQKFVKQMHPDILVIGVTGSNDFRNCSTNLEYIDIMRPYYRSTADEIPRFQFKFPVLRRWIGPLLSPLEVLRCFRWVQAARRVGYEAKLQPDEHAMLGKVDARFYLEPPTPEYAEATVLGQKFLRALIESARQTHAVVLVVYIPVAVEVIDDAWMSNTKLHSEFQKSARFNRTRPESIVRNVAVQAGARFLSFSEIARELPLNRQNRLWFVLTDGHFTEEGNLLFAQTLGSAITQILKESRNVPEAIAH